MDKSREEFEAFRDKRNALLESEGHKPGSKWHVTQAHYATWQASRAAVVVELPPIGDYLDTYQQGENRDAYLVAIREAIEAADLRVKS